MTATTFEPAVDLPEPTRAERRTALWLYVATFFGWVFPFGQLIAPACLWFAKRRESAFVDHHGKEVIRFQLIVTLIAYPMAFFMSLERDIEEALILPMFAIGLVELALLLRGALAANRGAWYRFPIPTM